MVQVSGQPQELFCIDIDLTDRKQAEDKLKVSEQLYRTLFDKANEGLILLTMDGKIAELNQSFAQMHGYSVNEMKNMDIKELDVLREGAFDGRAAVMQRLYNGEVVRFEVEHYHKKGHSFIMSDTVSIVTIAGQQYFLAFHQDITERKQAEEKLLNSERNLKESQQLAGLGTFDLDILAEIFRTSDILNEIFGIDETYDHSINGWAALLHPEDREKVVNHLMNDVIGNMQPGNIEFRIVRYIDKTTRWMHVLAKLALDANGHPVMLHGTAQDMTDRKQAEQELIITKEKAEESDRLKTAFLLNMSHEIRTPMNGILGFSNLLKEPGLTGEEQQEYIEIIEKSGERMLNIISEIVDISRIESGETVTRFEKSNINEQIENVYKLVKSDAENKGINLSFKNSLPDKEAFTITDQDKLYVILTNLLKNAIKYTDKGSIEFGYEIVETRHVLSLWQFYVKDMGIGIPKNRQEFIFERFNQADIADVQARQGAGLGLSIAKAYVEMLGGRIWVESEVEKGSVFYFTLPYNAKPEEKAVVENVVSETAGENLIKDLKILIAEDDEPSERLISIIVNEFSKEVIKVKTGIEAVETCRNNPDLDLILMDIQMPDLNGHEATLQIRQFNKGVVIIAQTAFGLYGDREKAIESGCNDYISKPINKAELLKLILKYFRK
jgi:PAS domain S-box-containing protein